MHTYSARCVRCLTKHKSGTCVNWFLFALSLRKCDVSDKAIVKLSPNLLSLRSLQESFLVLRNHTFYNNRVRNY